MSLDQLYRHLWSALAPGEVPELTGLAPARGPEWIFELVDGLELAAGSRILDLASGPGEHAVALADRYRARVVAVDPVVSQLADARRRAGERAISIAAGRMEAIPLAAGSVDLVWLRDALLHSGEPEATLLDCRRVLRAGGHLLLHSAFATGRLAPAELELLEADMHVDRAGLDAARVEAAISAAGFDPVRVEELGSELAEHYELADGLGSRALLRLARLERHPEILRERLGERRFRAMRGLYHWVVFELLGKLSYRTSLLRKPE